MISTGGSSAPRCSSRALRRVMKLPPQNCPRHSNAAITGMCALCAEIHHPTKHPGAQEMAGGSPLPRLVPPFQNRAKNLNLRSDQPSCVEVVFRAVAKSSVLTKTELKTYDR